MELGILSLSDLQTDPATGRPHGAGRRTHEIVSYAIAADQAGLDVFGLGEHHSPDFAVANPAIPLAAAAQATENIRLTSAVSVLSTLDPVRLHQDFASLDLISNGRAEIIAGRSAFLEAFALFGLDPGDYDAFEAVASPHGALVVGSPQEVIDKILTEHSLLGLSRFMGQIDFGAMPARMVDSSIELLATEIAPAIREAVS